MDFKEKYLKYKLKYLKLKSEIEQDGSGLKNLRERKNTIPNSELISKVATKAKKEKMTFSEEAKEELRTSLLLNKFDLLSYNYSYVKLTDIININFLHNRPLFSDFNNPVIDNLCSQIEARLLQYGEILPTAEIPALCLISYFGSINPELNRITINTFRQFNGVVINDYLNIKNLFAGSHQTVFNNYIAQALRVPKVLFIFSLRGTNGIVLPPIIPNNLIVINSVQSNDTIGAVDDFVFWLLGVSLYHAKVNKYTNNIILWSGDKQKIYDEVNGHSNPKNLQTELYSQGPIQLFQINNFNDADNLSLIEEIRKLLIIPRQSNIMGAPDISVYKPNRSLSSLQKKNAEKGQYIKSYCYDNYMEDRELHVIDTAICGLFFEQFISHINQIQYNEMIIRVEGRILPPLESDETVVGVKKEYNPQLVDPFAYNDAVSGKLPILP